MRKYIFLLLISLSLLSISSFNSYSQATKTELMDGFFTIFEEDIGLAVDYLFATNPMIDPSQPGIKSIKERFEVSRKLLGNYHGHEVVSAYYAGDSYVKMIYSLKYERQPLKFVVVLYKPKDKWKVQNINFMDDIDSEFRIREENN